MNLIDTYSGVFQAATAGSPEWWQRHRRAAFDRFAAAGFPSVRDEEWKYTDVAPIAKIVFQPATGADLPAATALAGGIGLGSGWHACFVHGRFIASLSRLPDPSCGLEVQSLASAFADSPAMLEGVLGSLGGATNDPFVDLNAALATDGAVIRIRRGRVIDEPIHLMFLSPSSTALPSATAIMSHPRVLIVAEESSRATVVETYIGSDVGEHFSNAVTEVILGANAEVRHCRIQREGAASFHIASVAARQERDSRLFSTVVSVGARLSRTHISSTLDGEGSECHLDGLYLGSGEQHVDHHTTIDHVRPHTTSRELYKGILDDRATGVFNGKVFVRPQAQKSDAQQMNKNLLLSDRAEVDTKPQLEIFADDVKCSHGATIGRLDDDALFYLRARGLDAATARGLLIYAFANEMIGRIAELSARGPLAAMVENRFGVAGAGDRAD